MGIKYNQRHPKKPRDIVERFCNFLQNSNHNDCILWVGGSDKHKNRYGRFFLKDNVFIGPHEFAYILYYKEDLKGGEIHHTCENKKCCNPLHLQYVGYRTHKLIHIQNYKRKYTQN